MLVLKVVQKHVILMLQSCTCLVVSRMKFIFRPWLWLKYRWVGGKRFFLKGLSFTLPNFGPPPPKCLRKPSPKPKITGDGNESIKRSLSPQCIKKRGVWLPWLFLACVVLFHVRGVGLTHIIRWQGFVPHLYKYWYRYVRSMWCSLRKLITLYLLNSILVLWMHKTFWVDAPFKL